jgi:hypothetical protein
MATHWWSRPAREQKTIRRWARALVQEREAQVARERAQANLEARRAELAARHPPEQWALVDGRWYVRG